MPRFYFSKLIRNKILQRSLDDPKVLKVEYRTLDDAGYISELVKKVHEEADEIPLNGKLTDEVISEIADVQAVIDALVEAYNIPAEDLEAAKAKKQEKNGAFDERIYIDYVDLADDSEWVGIFRAQPDKYREEKIDG